MIKELQSTQLRCAIYIRVSTNEQAQEGFSLDAQKRRLLAYAESQDWQVSGIYLDDGYSAKDLNRPQMKRMLSDMLDDHFDIVLVYKLDRLTRSAADCDHLLKLFESHNVMFQSSTESFETRTATGRLFIRIISDLAQWERELISERVRSGMEQKALEGKKPGGRHAFGYDSKGNLIEEEAEQIRMLRTMYMEEGKSFKKIAVAMVERGLMRRGFEWTQSTVALTLENPYYAGIIRFGSRMSNGKYAQRKRKERTEITESMGDHETIWTVEEFNEHVALMESRSTGGYSRNLEYWFTGLLRCGKCGSSMYGRLTTKRSLKDGSLVRTPYYWCNRRKENDTCKMPMFRQVHIEHLLLQFIDDIRLDKELVGEQQKQAISNKVRRDKEIQRNKRELDAIRTRIKKWQYMFVNDLITAESLRERMNEETIKERELTDRLTSLEDIAEESDELVVHLRELADLWSEMDDKEKKEMLMITFDEITINTDLVNIKGVKNKYFDATIQVKYK